MTCDFSAANATRISYRLDKLNGYDRMHIEFTPPATSFQGFEIQLFLRPEMNLSGVSGYQLNLSIEKTVN